MIGLWLRYWFRPSPVFDLAVLRVAACGVGLFHAFLFHDYFAYVRERAQLGDETYAPIFLFKLLHAPFGWGYDAAGVWAVRPDGAIVEAVLTLGLVAGLMALIGAATRLSVATFAASFIYVQGYLHSFNDFHHSTAILAVALSALALSPCGRALSVDAWIAARRGAGTAPDEDDAFARWPILLIQWFFVLMYLSAVVSKLGDGGIDWANGYTLQYYLARDGLRWDNDLAVWLSQFHTPILLGQIGVLLFQASFALAVIFPRLRWVYVPCGLALHVGIYVALGAPFFTWIALYAAFIPWSAAVRRFSGRGQVAGPASRA